MAKEYFSETHIMTEHVHTPACSKEPKNSFGNYHTAEYTRPKPTATEIRIAKRIRAQVDASLRYLALPWYKRMFTRRPR